MLLRDFNSARDLLLNRWVRSLQTLGVSGHFGFSPHCAELRSFAAKISQTVETTVKIQQLRLFLSMPALARV